MAAINDLRNPMSTSVDGMKPLQDELQRLTLATATGPGGEMRNNLLLALLQLQRYALGIVHVDTGRLKNSIFTDLETVGNDLMGHVATNVEYAIFEEMRAGSKGVYGGHNFFGRTVREEGPNVVENNIFRPVMMGGR